MAKPQIKGALSEEAHRGWQRLLTTEGVTAAALLEALGLALDDRSWSPTKRVVAEARKIDRQRGSRR